MKSTIGMIDKDCDEEVKALMALLPDEYVVYTKTWNYRWHVPRLHFSDLPTFFDPQDEERDASRGKMAERARAAGRCAIGTLQEFTPHAKMKERPPPIRVIER